MDLGLANRRRDGVIIGSPLWARGYSMTVIFQCGSCSQKIYATNESGGSTLQCANCFHPSVVPTTLPRANEIADRIEDLLIKQDYVAGIFVRLSRVGATTRMEALHALYIVMAQTFQAVFRRPTTTDTQKKFDEVACAAGSIQFRFGGLTPLLPDAELDLIVKLHNVDDTHDSQRTDESREEKVRRFERRLEFSNEEQRLQLLAMSDAAWNQSETMDSFVSFLRTLDPAGQDYWTAVYGRIGQPCPLPDDQRKAAPSPESEKSWWRRLFS
jgi:hypothetical protein